MLWVQELPFEKPQLTILSHPLSWAYWLPPQKKKKMSTGKGEKEADAGKN